MNKRQFLNLLTGALASPVIALLTVYAKEPLKNWAGNISYSTSDISDAQSVDQVRSIVRAACTTAAHGSGREEPDFASAVSALEMVTASGLHRKVWRGVRFCRLETVVGNFVDSFVIPEAEKRKLK